MEKFSKYSFMFGLSSVVAPMAIYVLYTYLFPAKQVKQLPPPTPVAVKKTEVVTEKKEKKENVAAKPKDSRKVRVLYATCTGTAQSLAHKLAKRIDNCTKFLVEVSDLKTYDEDKLDSEDIVLFICSTWSEGHPPESAKMFFEWLKDFACDFRVSKNHLSKVKFAMFGLGGDIYGEYFAKAPKEIHEYMTVLGAVPLMEPEFGDDASDLEMKYNRWSSKIATIVQNEYNKDRAKTVTQAPPPPKNKKPNALQVQQKIVKAESQPASAAAVVSKPVTTTAAASKECCNGENSGSGSCCNSGNAGGVTVEGETDADEPMEEEDIVNAKFITMDQTEEPTSCCGGSTKNKGKGKKASGDSCCSTYKKKTAVVATTTTTKVVDDPTAPPLDDSDAEPCHSDQEDDEEEEADTEKDGDLLDVEDIGSKMSQAQRRALKEQLSGGADITNDDVKREMVTKLQRKALTKEGYRIIGTHSAVKLCRWTKNQMRGRGGCYKHSFYGITSYQCMEATPSLACANKCVFCWRHHKNPVGTEWRWKEDAPAFIVEEAVELHRGMINEMKGVPGVQPDRLAEAFTVKHCALSLVGEPIMYPRINEMLQELHNRDISTFLVTNAQFPERIKQLDPVTQLYVSVDASTKDSLKAIDRPLFKDFWERFLDSLKEMRDKKQRTVYRMTLVKAYNMDEADGYCELIESGMPDFIEIKAVTYCGKSDASSLTMQNVPWHHEVCVYGEAICARLAERGVIQTRYSIATEHQHSCCILLAREDKFKVQGVWNTWIDYPRFQELMRAYYASGGKATFTSQDYMAPTPDWALYQSASRGFDPEEQRWHRKKAGGALEEVEYKPSESGCG